MPRSLPLSEINEAQKSQAQSPQICYHCGDSCEDKPIRWQDKVFCCNGCQTVYEILAENDLCTYYNLEQNPGIKLKNRDFGDKFAFLDNAEIAHNLLSFAEGDTHKVTLFLPTIHCSSCIWLLENLYRLREGITYTRVNFMRKEMTVTFNPNQISFRELAELLTTLGYEPQINLQDLNEKKRRADYRSLFYKIGVTGFCFGNIMLLSFPDYLALEDWVDQGHKYFFGYLNILLALPVFFYASADYFKSAFKSLRAGAINLDVPISLGIIALFGRSLYEIITMTGAGYMDSLAGLLFFLLVGKWFQDRTYESLSFERDYQSYFPLAVKVKDPKTEGTFIKKVTSLEKNDLMLIRNRELIPTDSILVSEKAYIDYSFVTGEADPIEKIQGDYIYAGGRQVGSSIELAVQKEVSQSYLTQLWNSEVFTKTQDEKMSSLVAKVSKYFTYATLSIAFGAALFWYWMDASVMWNAFTAVLIVACPCALALSMPYALGNTMRIFGRNRFYLKNSSVVGLMAEIDHLVFDKTGTITSQEGAEIHYQGKTLSDQEKIWIKSLAQHSTHPLSKKLAASLPEVDALKTDYYKEIEGKGIYGRIQGASIKIGSAEFTESWDCAQDLDVSNLQSLVFVHIDGACKGYFSIQNQYRSGFSELIQDLKNHYQTSLVTGDNDAEKKRLSTFFGDESQLRFQQKPKDKLEFIQSLQRKPKRVLMLGDGLNDAGALQQSDVGIAITEDTTSFSPACDAILDAANFHRLPKFLHFAKTSIRVVRASFLLSFLYNLFGVAFAVSGNLSPVLAAVLMPMSSITVVAFVVLMTNWLAKRQGLLESPRHRLVH